MKARKNIQITEIDGHILYPIWTLKKGEHLFVPGYRALRSLYSTAYRANKKQSKRHFKVKKAIGQWEGESLPGVVIVRDK